MNILIGSRALAHWSNVPIKPTTDWDIISENDISSVIGLDDMSLTKIEWHDKSFLNNYAFDNFASDVTGEIDGVKFHVMNQVGLTIIKRSHLWRDLSFSKHITHYHKHLVHWRKTFLPLTEHLLQERIRLTMEAYPQGHPSLMQSVEGFFDDAVTKKYNHDWLHELVAFYSKPLYTRLQHNPEMAWCEKVLWDKLSYEEQLQCVAEETYVIAMERFLIPKDWDYPYQLAYMKALAKVCTTLCSGWFRDFAIDNYPSILGLFNADKINAVKAIIEKE